MRASDIAQWQQQIDDTIIRAPFSGVVISKNAQPGEMISPMSVGGFTRTGICTVVDMSWPRALPAAGAELVSADSSW